MPHAAHFVLDGEKLLAALGIDDVLEAILMLIAFFHDQLSLYEPAIRPREIRDVHLHVMPVIVRNRAVGFAENEFLPDSHWHSRGCSGGILRDGRRRAHDSPIESRNSVRRP